MAIYRVLLCKYEPREHILSERGVCLLKYLVVYRFLGTIICLSTNTQHGFFYAKTDHFRVDFPSIPVGAAICRPPERESVPTAPAQRVQWLMADGYGLTAQYGNLPPAKTATPFSLIFSHNVRNIIAAKPRRILKSDS